MQSGIPGDAGELPLGGGDAGASVSFLVTALDRDSGQVAWEKVTVDQDASYTVTGAPRVIDGPSSRLQGRLRLAPVK